MANTLGIGNSEAEEKLNIIDDDHHEFFKKIFLREKIASGEFDLVIPMDHIPQDIRLPR